MYHTCTQNAQKRRRGKKKEKRRKERRCGARVRNDRSKHGREKKSGIDRYIYNTYIYTYIVPSSRRIWKLEAKKKRFESTSREYSGLPCTCWSGTTRKRKRERKTESIYRGSRELIVIDEERETCDRSKDPFVPMEQIYITNTRSRSRRL